MEELWKYSLDSNEVLGPVPAKDVAALVARGILGHDALLQKQGSDEWMTVISSPFATDIPTATIRGSGSGGDEALSRSPEPSNANVRESRGSKVGSRKNKVIGSVFLAIVFVVGFGIYVRNNNLLSVISGKRSLNSEMVAIQRLSADISACHLLTAYRYQKDPSGQSGFVVEHLRKVEIDNCPGPVQMAFTDYLGAWEVFSTDDVASIHPLILRLSAEETKIPTLSLQQRNQFNSILRSYNEIQKAALPNGVYIKPVKEF